MLLDLSFSQYDETLYLKMCINPENLQRTVEKSCSIGQNY